MQSFLEEVIDNLADEFHALEDTVFVLPSKRAGNFLITALANKSKKTFFSPEVFSIEGFVEKISGISYANNTQQLFELYSIYRKTSKTEVDSFFAFSKWGQTLLQDINEIDRYLLDANALFSNLSAIQEVSHWSLEGSKTKMIQDYLDFWNGLEALYTNFNTVLLQKGIGHQGLVYREACKQLENYLAANSHKKHVFIGFNALNEAESTLIQNILEKTDAEIYWDLDTYFLNDPIHDAGLFIRAHQKSWPYLQNIELKGISAHYSTKKNIQIIGVPKNVSQAKYLGKLLKNIHQENLELLKKTAVVLSDESLLNPVLNSIPKEIEAINITMGYPLNKTPLADLFIQIIGLYINREEQGWFYRNILELLSHPYIKVFLTEMDSDFATRISTEIKDKNWIYISSEKLNDHSYNCKQLLLLFSKETPSSKDLIKRCIDIIWHLKPKFEAPNDALALEYLYRFFNLFNQLLTLVEENNFINDLKSLQGLFKELLSSETVDFQGDPLEGLQIMGMLESRNLDFETVIITSVNEGILPSGKSNNSFIPFDLKVNFGLPTYKEKDAVYTYHFYRLLQRAKNVYILYNTEPDVLEGGEKSRLIAQLLTDPAKAEDITATVAMPKIQPNEKQLIRISKDDGLMQLISQHAAKGFSPTSLSNYIRNPLDFYKRNLLGINDALEVEETIAANTFGSIVHDSLEELYAPFVGNVLNTENLKAAKKEIHTVVKRHFTKSYTEGDISTGKNLIAFKVVERYISNFLDLEIADVQNHEVEIIGIEQRLSVELDIPGLDFPVILKGKLDRIDRKDGQLRIIDYKTGKVESKNVEIADWQAITTDYDFSKAFQLLCYALMFRDTNPEGVLESGIISFKNLNAGMLRFATKPSKGSRTKDHSITSETLLLFKEQLNKLILEICDSGVPLTEKEI